MSTGVAAYFYTLSTIRNSMSNINYFQLSTPPSLPNSTSSALPKLNSKGNLISGAIARVSIGFVFSPVTVIKARFEVSILHLIIHYHILQMLIHLEQSNLFSYPSIPAAFVSIVKTSGLKGLFQGFVPTALRDAPYAGLYVLIYEKGKDRLSSEYQSLSQL